MRRSRKRQVVVEYIRRRSFLRQVTRVVLWLRVSRRTQRRRKNLDDQESWLRRALAGYRITVIEVFRDEVSGKLIGNKLREAITFAKMHDAVLVAESTDRFIRHPDYHSSNNPDAQAGIPELKILAAAAAGVPLVTMLHPDASPKRVRSHQRKRGQEGKGNKGGGDRMPGFKTRLRVRILPRVIALSKRMGYDRIARITGVPKPTIQNWLSRYRSAV